jgi:hypothetical protein
VIRLGLRANWRQFALLVLINAFVGATVGLERAVLPLLGEQEFGLGREHRFARSSRASARRRRWPTSSLVGSPTLRGRNFVLRIGWAAYSAARRVKGI